MFPFVTASHVGNEDSESQRTVSDRPLLAASTNRTSRTKTDTKVGNEDHPDFVALREKTARAPALSQTLSQSKRRKVVVVVNIEERPSVEKKNNLPRGGHASSRRSS